MKKLNILKNNKFYCFAASFRKVKVKAVPVLNQAASDENIQGR
jgi:hypothetical protein